MSYRIAEIIFYEAIRNNKSSLIRIEYLNFFLLLPYCTPIIPFSGSLIIGTSVHYNSNTGNLWRILLLFFDQFPSGILCIFSGHFLRITHIIIIMPDSLRSIFIQAGRKYELLKNIKIINTAHPPGNLTYRLNPVRGKCGSLMTNILA